MTEIVNKLLLVGDTFIPEMHLKQPGFTKERIEMFMRTGNTDFIYKN